jgi:hypothetical protein
MSTSLPSVGLKMLVMMEVPMPERFAAREVGERRSRCGKRTTTWQETRRELKKFLILEFVGVRICLRTRVLRSGKFTKVEDQNRSNLSVCGREMGRRYNFLWITLDENSLHHSFSISLAQLRPNFDWVFDTICTSRQSV